jgi:CBS domain-containing protein
LLSSRADAATQVAAVMTHRPDCAREDDTYMTACKKMSAGGYRHLPVVDAHGAPVGMLSVKDLLLAQVFYLDQMVGDKLIPTTEHEVLDELAAIPDL